MKEWGTIEAAYSGCGTTLSIARRSIGERALRRNRSAAVLDHLGYTLMRASQNCLPPDALERAKTWPDLTEEAQCDELNWLINALRHRPTELPPIDAIHRPTLPLEIGAWDSQSPRPSCLAMTIIVAAYALATQAEFLIASVQRVSGEPIATELAVLLGGAHELAISLLPTAADTDPLPALLRHYIEEATAGAQRMITRREFHGAVLLRLRCGCWACIDPYMNNLGQFDRLRRPVDWYLAVVKKNPRLSGSMLGKPTWEQLPELREELQILAALLKRVQSGAVLNADLPVLELPGALCRLMKRRLPNLALNEGDLLCQAVSSNGHNPDEDTARAIVAAGEHDSQRATLRSRILLAVIRAWANRVWKTAQEAYLHEPHSAMTLGDKKRTLGAWTVINLRHRSGQPWAADLLPHTDSEVVTYNALMDYLNGGCLDPPEIKLLSERLTALMEIPPQYLHPMLLQGLKEGRHGD